MPVDKMATPEEVLKIVDGTSESEARDNLGKERREMTGVLAQNSRVRFLKLSSKVMKPISIFNSALGLTISILLLTEDKFWSIAFWISLLVGIIIGSFFELWSTNSEHAFATDDKLEVGDEDKSIYKLILISVKIYAVVLVLVSAWNLPDYILVQKTLNIKDNDYIISRLSQIKRLNADKDASADSAVTTAIYQMKIDRLSKEVKKIEREKTAELVKNSTSIQIKKREDALKTIASINQRIDVKNAEIAKAEADMIATAGGKTQKQLYEEKITKKEAEIVKEREKLRLKARKKNRSTLGITIMLGVLFVLLELGGTFASILAQRTVLKSVSPEEAHKESVTNKLFSENIALRERNTRLRATKISSDIKQNKTMTAVIKYESEAMAQNHELLEKTRLAEIDRENARLLTESKLRELESNQLMAMTDGVAKKLEGLDTIRTQIGRVLEKDR